MGKAARVARVGIIVECGRDGLEVHLCRRVCTLLREQHGVAFEEDILPMDNKKRLLQEAGTVAVELLEGGCHRVVILWDEEPAWPKKDDPLCWHQERQALLESLRGARRDVSAVHLVCIERAAESWLLHDAPLLSSLLSRPTHKVKVKVPSNAHRLRNAKGVLMRIYKKHGGEYRDVTVARRLAAALDSLDRLLCCATFRRFAERVSGQSL